MCHCLTAAAQTLSDRGKTHCGSGQAVPHRHRSVSKSFNLHCRTSRAQRCTVFLTIGFLSIISSAGLIQTTAELRRGERRKPSTCSARPRPRKTSAHSKGPPRCQPGGEGPAAGGQYARFAWLADAGEKAVVGRDGWLFYRPGVEYITQRPPAKTSAETAQDPITAIASFRDELAARGIRLLVVPVPNKESLSEKLSRRAQGAGVISCRQARELLQRLGSAESRRSTCSGFQRTREERTYSNPRELYLSHDTHWSPEGVRLAAEATVRRVIERVGSLAAAPAMRSAPKKFNDWGTWLKCSKLPSSGGSSPSSDSPAGRWFAASRQRRTRTPDAQVLVLATASCGSTSVTSRGRRVYCAPRPAAPATAASIVSDGGRFGRWCARSCAGVRPC